MMTSMVAPPTSPGKTLDREIENLNREFSLGIPIPKELQSPSSRPLAQRPKGQQCYVLIKALFWKSREGFNRALTDFREEARSERRASRQWVHKPNQDDESVPSRERYGEERLNRMDTLLGYLRDEMWIAKGGEGPLGGSHSAPRPRNLANGPPRVSDEQPAVAPTPKAKRKPDNDQEVFHTAPSSPTLSIQGEYPSVGNLDEYNDPTWNELHLNANTLERADGLKFEVQRSSTKKRQSKITDHMRITKQSQESHSTTEKSSLFVSSGNTALSTALSTSSSMLPGPPASPEVSFETTVDSVFDRAETPSRNLGTSFETTITEPDDDTFTQADSVEALMMSEEANMMMKSLEDNDSPTSFEDALERPFAERKMLGDLLQNGPFSKKEGFSRKVPLRARYELERIRQEWKVEAKQILVGDKPPEKQPDFWQWLRGLSQRMEKILPEKPSIKAWNAAIGRYQGERHSEAVVLGGALDWCDKDEPGIFKLRLNPLKIDRTCRFHRRFGSDRFLSITIPAPSKPPSHLRLRDISSLRETLTEWLVKNDHYLLGRTWRAFYIDDHKKKNKSKSDEPRVRVDFFAVDGSDFTVKLNPPTLSPANETCESHTRMTVDQLIQWHIPLDHNKSQTDCKLFSRIDLALSKTWGTVVLQPNQIRELPDTPGKPVMNDGCALMSRPLARAICAELGIDGLTPSCFQGRIAGAKGLWMVHRDQDDDESFWIEISDSQLKIKPHPRNFFGSFDKEKVTFEVASWSKPLRPSELNAQLLEVLNNRGQVKNRVSEIARNAIREVSMEFETVMEKNSIPLARALIQKIRPTPEDGSSRTNLRRVDQWISQNIEAAIRFLEAGFSPREFFPLRERMRICLSDTLHRYVNELHIPVSLSTYAYCIADPYKILEEDEVHFALSSQWRDCSFFDDSMVDGMDVLVGRLPAHCPWDIQRRKAVSRPELRHFKDVIVFSTKGTTPLASLLSGGDYDGDRPWICWDKGIVENFINTTPPSVGRGPEHFGLVKHARPMATVDSVGELLENAFKFNLASSNLGRCTVEHEKIAYEEPGGLGSPLAIELSMLLSLLVDSKKSGFQLMDERWSKYRSSISPVERRVPAYKNLVARKWKCDNINDFLRFDVALQEREQALEKFSRLYGSSDNIRDEDLLRPWKTVAARAEREKNGDFGMPGPRRPGNTELYEALKEIRAQIDEACTKWREGARGMPLVLKVQVAAELVNAILPPTIDHPLAHTWQNSEYEWQVLLASGAYFMHWQSAFPLYAAGETLCRIKTGKQPARLIRDQIYISMKVNSTRARRLAGEEAEEPVIDDDELESDTDSEGFDRQSVFDVMFEMDRQYRHSQ